MLLTVIIILFLLSIVYLLFIPILIVIDTKNNQYYIQLKGLARANFIADKKEIFRVQLKVLFLKFNFYPLKKKSLSKPLKEEKKLSKKKSKSSMDLNKGLRIIKSFRIRKIYLNIDTGDCITNAKLYPVFAFLNYYKGGLNINFNGQNTILLAVENRPIRIIKSFINI